MITDAPLCPQCLIGRLHLRLITYTGLYGKTLVSVPNTPAWQCDVCHSVDFDAAALLRIETLVEQAGPPPNRYRPPQPRETRPPRRITPAKRLPTRHKS